MEEVDVAKKSPCPLRITLGVMDTQPSQPSYLRSSLLAALLITKAPQKWGFLLSGARTTCPSGPEDGSKAWETLMA